MIRLRFALVVSAGALMFLGAGERDAKRVSVGAPVQRMALAAVPTPAGVSAISSVLPQDADSITIDAGTIGRWLSYLGVFLLLGAVAFLPIAHRAFRDRDPILEPVFRSAQEMSRTMGLIGAALYLLGAGGRLYAQALSFLFPGDTLTIFEVRTILFDSIWGTRWLIQVSAALVAGIGFALGRRGWQPGGQLGTAGAFAVAVTLPLTGHAMAASWHWAVTWPLQAAHVLAGGIWLGSLLVVTIVGFSVTVGKEKEIREQAVARLIGSFSPVAVAGVVAVALMGIVLTVAYVGSWAALWQTTYGRTLLIKILLLAGTGLVGAYNWRRLRPGLGTPGSAARLRFSARVELVLGGVLLLATAILVALPAPHL